MNQQILLGFILYSFVAAITPGPNNIMLLASGLNFGFKRSISHMCGITIGFALMLVIVGAGIHQVFDAYPIIHIIMQYLSTVYIIYLAIKIAFSPTINVSNTSSNIRPMTFFNALMFQWINPKAWMMGVVALTSYSLHNYYPLNIFLITSIATIVGIPSLCFWAYCGSYLKRYLEKPHYLKIFNLLMGLLLIISIIPTLIELFKMVFSVH